MLVVAGVAIKILFVLNDRFEENGYSNADSRAQTSSSSTEANKGEVYTCKMEMSACMNIVFLQFFFLIVFICLFFF